MNNPPSLKRTRERFHLTEAQLADHLGVTKHSVQCYERGNLEVPEPVVRLLFMLVGDWVEHGYREAEEMWGQWST